MAMQNRIAQLEQRLTVLERCVDLIASEVDHRNDPGPLHNVPRETSGDTHIPSFMDKRGPGRPKKVTA